MVTRAKPEASFASTRLTRSNYYGPPLLSQVGGKKVREDSKYGKGPDPEKESGEKRVFEPATDDEPLSSSDEAESSAESLDYGKTKSLEGKGNRSAQKSLEEKLADEDAATGTGNRASPRKNNGRSTAVDSLRDGSRKSTRQHRRQSPKRTFSDLIGTDDEEDELFPSFMSSSQASKRRRNIGYGGLKNVHTGSSFKVPASSMLESSQQEAPSPGFKKPAEMPNLDEPTKDTTSEEENSGFKVPMEIEIASPQMKKGKKKGTKRDAKPTFKIPPGSTEHDVVSHSSPSREFKHPLPFPNDGISSSSLATSSAKDRLFDLDDDNSSLGSLSSVESDLLLDDQDKTVLASQHAVPEPSDEALCPMCKQRVDRDVLLDFLAQPKQRVRDQERFCESHRKESAEQEWRDKGYPTIDWEGFDERIRGHFAALEKILTPDCHSFYRNILDGEMKSGKAKNFRLSLAGEGLENMSCGYYGSKGAGKMLHAVTTQFSKKLRRLATTDHLVKTAGVTTYAQAVLVPELTVLLVKEDMGVSDETARQILRETIDIGEKLNYVPNDVVPIPEDAENAV
ncbi:hypothetical protein DTO021C3_7318 [Paecilomyces variotii]|nr:hypothetical protein DTO195F2_7 [Paecilomyces variotii]KAJ9285159.1 hypothetical protein DTO021C3_7318 [Paecilomyces variotii]KAJ9362412.1 hypothetical protein DTO027B9_89 [Paecilomyces variotii]KAJ9397848.1 hypothetical protein DTO282F9_5167 [Paecilomyces variotii]